MEYLDIDKIEDIKRKCLKILDNSKLSRTEISQLVGCHPTVFYNWRWKGYNPSAEIAYRLIKLQEDNKL